MCSLVFYCGTVGAGKTHQLMSAFSVFKEKNKKCFVIKPKIDIRGGKDLITHDNYVCRVNHLLNHDELVSQIIPDDIDVLLIDEIQFLNIAQIEDILLLSHKIHVICAGLLMDFQNNVFESSERLLKYNITTYNMSSDCAICGDNANYNGRFINNVLTKNGERVIIHGIDNVEYKPLCRKCYNGI